MAVRPDVVHLYRSSVLIALVIVTTAASLAAIDNLPQSLRDLPYRPEVAAITQIDAESDANTIAWGDVDGDGFEDMVCCQNLSVFCFLGGDKSQRLAWQQPISPPFDKHRPVAAVSVDYDLEGDGEPDVVVVARTADGWQTRVWILDRRTGRSKTNFDLRGVADRRPDGIWDGRYFPWGGVPRNEGPGEYLVLGACVAYDAVGRGVRVIDPRTGSVVWEYLCGPAPSSAPPEMADLDGDGLDEIVLAGAGHGNLHGELVNGTSDDSCRVFVLTGNGELVWQRALAKEPSSAHTAVGDLDLDGASEVVTIAQHSNDNISELFVFRGRTGEIIARRTIGSRAQNPQVLSGQSGTRPAVYFNCIDLSSVIGLRLGEDNELQVVQEGHFPSISPTGAILGDLVGDAAPEVIVGDGIRGSLVCDATLSPLCYVPNSDVPRFDGTAKVWRLNEEKRLLITNGRPREAVALVLEPRKFPWPQVSAVAATLVAVAAGLLGARRRRTPTDDPAVVRELRRQLLGRLQILRHEKFGTLENLERLIWYLSAAQEADPATDAGLVRIRALVADTRTSTLVRLRDIAALARRMGVRDVRVVALDENCDELRAVLDMLDESAATGAAALALTSLQELNEALKRESRLIRAELEAHFQADLPVVLAEVLRAQAEELLSAGITVTIAGMPVEPQTWMPTPDAVTLICDRDDLAFILDNLIGNAIRAMAAMPRRDLAVTWQSAESQIQVRVSDTGCGIPPDDWERVLAGEGSTREGGGLGFKQTRELLKFYRGDLWIESSKAGGGTVVVMTMHAQQGMDRHRETTY
jgi:signal transduction histidine kinase